MYTPQYGDIMIKYVNGRYRICVWKQSKICGRLEDHWDMFSWAASDREDFVQEHIRNLKKVADWACPSANLPKTLGYYRAKGKEDGKSRGRKKEHPKD